MINGILINMENQNLETDASVQHQREENFLEFRNISASKINNEICIPYYEQGVRLETLVEKWDLSEEELEIIGFILDSFKRPKSSDKLKRKDGRYIAVHSLQLFITARDFYGITDPDILYTLLLHDVAEDTQISLEDIKNRLGEKFSGLTSALTEQREDTENEIPSSRKRDVVRFTAQIAKAGFVAISAEIIDRIDDISDLGYILSKLREKPDNDTEKTSAKNKLLEKFAKCSYTVSRISVEENELIQKLNNDFEKLMWEQIEKIRSEYGINISEEEINDSLKDYSEIEEKFKEKSLS